jgi:hypothetical protein
MKKRKVNYPPARTANRPVRGAGLAGDRPIVRSTVAEINLQALSGRDDISVGDFVRIGGGGLHAGELAIVDAFVGGLIPAARVRTEAGKTRRVRMVDLERVAGPDQRPVTDN